mgnify:CR=1 FL=1
MARRDEILESALELVQRDGIGALSVRGVATAAGIGATTLRHHFPSQADLHQAVAVRLVGNTLDDLDIADDSVDPAERLSNCLLQFLPRPSNQAVALGGWFELYRLALGPDPVPAVHGLLKSGHGSSAERLASWFSVLAEQGHLAPGDIGSHVTRALALIDGLHLNLLLDPDRVDLDGAIDSVRWFASVSITR